MKAILSVIVIITMMLVLMTGGCFNPPTIPINKVYVSPESYYKVIGNTFTVSIVCESIEDVNGFETTVHYDPSICHVTGFSWGNYILPENAFMSDPTIDNTNGIVSNIFAVSLIGGINTSATLISFTFEPIGVGTSRILLEDTLLVNSTSVLNVNITNGIVVVAG